MQTKKRVLGDGAGTKQFARTDCSSVVQRLQFLHGKDLFKAALLLTSLSTRGVQRPAQVAQVEAFIRNAYACPTLRTTVYKSRVAEWNARQRPIAFAANVNEDAFAINAFEDAFTVRH